MIPAPIATGAVTAPIAATPIEAAQDATGISIRVPTNLAVATAAVPNPEAIAVAPRPKAAAALPSPMKFMALPRSSAPLEKIGIKALSKTVPIVLPMVEVKTFASNSPPIVKIFLPTVINPPKSIPKIPLDFSLGSPSFSFSFSAFLAKRASRRRFKIALKELSRSPSPSESPPV